MNHNNQIRVQKTEYIFFYSGKFLVQNVIIVTLWIYRKNFLQTYTENTSPKVFSDSIQRVEEPLFSSFIFSTMFSWCCQNCIPLVQGKLLSDRHFSKVLENFLPFSSGIENFSAGIVKLHSPESKNIPTENNSIICCCFLTSIEKILLVLAKLHLTCPKGHPERNIFKDYPEMIHFEL